MVCAFQDRENLYLVIDFMTGGDLRYHLSRRGAFTENETSIYFFYIYIFISENHFFYIKNFLYVLFLFFSNTFIPMV